LTSFEVKLIIMILLSIQPNSRQHPQEEKGG